MQNCGRLFWKKNILAQDNFVNLYSDVSLDPQIPICIFSWAIDQERGGFSLGREVSTNKAEIIAGTKALLAVVEFGYKRIILNLDNKAAVQVIFGNSRVKNALSSAFTQFQEAASNFEEVRIRLISREENKLADSIAHKELKRIRKDYVRCQSQSATTRSY